MAFRTSHIQTDGSINIDGSIYQWNVNFTGGTGTGSVEYAWNGLTKTDNSIGLGGIIRENVYIDISTHTFQIGDAGSNDPLVTISNGNISLLHTGPIGGIWINHSGVTIESSGLVYRQSSGPTGLIQYEGDYTASMTNNRMLPDIGWVNTRKWDVSTRLVKEVSIGTGLNWVGGYLTASLSSCDNFTYSSSAILTNAAITSIDIGDKL
jgi:hypothetical protein